DDALEVGVDLFQRPWRYVLIEMSREGDLVPGLSLVPVDPRIGDVRLHLGVEVRLHRVLERAVRLGVITPAERDVLGVAERGDGLEVALVLTRLDAAVVGGLVVDADRLPQLLALRRREPYAVVAEVAAELLVERLPVKVHLVTER